MVKTNGNLELLTMKVEKSYNVDAMNSIFDGNQDDLLGRSSNEQKTMRSKMQ